MSKLSSTRLSYAFLWLLRFWLHYFYFIEIALNNLFYEKKKKDWYKCFFCQLVSVFLALQVTHLNGTTLNTFLCITKQALLCFEHHALVNSMRPIYFRFIGLWFDALRCLWRDHRLVVTNAEYIVMDVNTPLTI